MSSSFLKPSVTPATAFATRLRARPWNFASSGLSPRFASKWPSASSKLMPLGYACFSLPFGPWTSTAPSSTLTVTPFGIVIGFFPIRDMSSPNVTEHFAAHARLDRIASGHHAARRRQDARAEAGQDLRHVVASEVDAAAGAADALNAGDQPLAMRSVLQEQPQCFRDRFRVRFLEQLESLDVAFVLQDPRDVRLDAGGRHIDARVLGRHGIADPRKHIGDGICHIPSNLQLVSWRGALTNSPTLKL